MTYNRFIQGLKAAGCRGRPQDPGRPGRQRRRRRSPRSSRPPRPPCPRTSTPRAPRRPPDQHPTRTSGRRDAEARRDRPTEPLLTATSGRVKAARKLARRACRAPSTGCSSPRARRPSARRCAPARAASREVFATAEAADRHADAAATPPRRRRRRGTLVDDEALAALAETVTPQGLVRSAGFLDVAARRRRSRPRPAAGRGAAPTSATRATPAP